jgi:D-alanyl-lipoteichoic acid acyltransferase DltB (MBOAT superfamily)
VVFNSLQFVLFFAIVYPTYLALSHRKQNWFLLAASYLFYASWDWRFLSLILLSTSIDFFSGLKMADAKSARSRRLILIASLAANLGILGVFKYFNFFADSLQGLAQVFGWTLDARFVNIILPVGISFYTFQSMSYSLDVYRRAVEPTKRFMDFALYVAFFPQLVAGPIERAKQFLPQVTNPRTIRLADVYEGCFEFFWGLFLKVFVADNLALLVDPVYGQKGDYVGVSVILATYAFMFQIFCDFAGYSSMARGLGRLMGFDISLNFNLPFFAVNVQDYWNRWHISLSQWIRDYLYFPLVSSLRGRGNTRVYGALLISMTLIGLWHGAAWTYVLFGVYYGVLLVLYVRLRSSKLRLDPKGPIAKHVWTLVCMGFMFHLVAIGMMIFRAEYLAQPYEMLASLATNFGGFGSSFGSIKFLAFHLALLLAVQVAQYWRRDLMCVYHAPVSVRTAFYVCCTYLLLMYGKTDGQEFIYFQF